MRTADDKPYNSAMMQTLKFASRAGEKLDAALDAFGIDVTGLTCADFGCNVGGFTDCLLSHGAAKVYALDAGYGELAWKLRKDPRVAVMERTNVLYCPPAGPVDLVTVDVAWTPQSLVIPAARRWLAAFSAGAESGRRPVGVVSLLKPHYELTKMQRRKPVEVLTEEQSRQVCHDVCEALARDGHEVRAVMKSALIGKGGNAEFLLLISP